MPGTDPAEAMRIIAGELPSFPHLAELPARGPGADLTGCTVAPLIDMSVKRRKSSGRQLAAGLVRTGDLSARSEAGRKDGRVTLGHGTLTNFSAAAESVRSTSTTK